MKKIINLLKAHGVEVYEGTPGNYFANDRTAEICINFWDMDETLDFLGYEPKQTENKLKII